MYDFNKDEKEFLKRFGETGNGKELARLLYKINANIDRASNIPTGSEYAAQVEGRRITSQFIKDMMHHMGKGKKEGYGTKPTEVGDDNYD